MTALIDRQKILAAAGSDKELAYKLRTYSGRVRFDLPERAFDLVVEDGVPARAEDVHADLAADVTFSAPAEFWSTAFSAAVPPVGYESCTAGMARGLSVVGDFAPWQSGWARLYQVVRETVAGAPVRKPFQDPFRETDNAVGRYVYVSANGQEARIYYETSGHGPIPLLLQATAGADGRQYRHLLADPRMQERFTMYAYDLPYHGKSLPPIGVRWWEETYRPGRGRPPHRTTGPRPRRGRRLPRAPGPAAPEAGGEARRGEGAVARVLELTGGNGVDVAIDAVGAIPAISTALACVALGGTFGVLLGGDLPVTAQNLFGRQVTIVPVTGNP
jgi:hypothetical protein